MKKIGRFRIQDWLLTSDEQDNSNKFMWKTFQAEKLQHERFLTLDHSYEIFFDICPTELLPSRQNLGSFLENKVIKQFELSKNVKTNFCPFSTPL